MDNPTFFTEIGLVNNFDVQDDPALSRLLIRCDSPRAGAINFWVTTGVAYHLWFNLTRMLFPRAANQLTPRMPTAMIQQPGDLHTVRAVRLFYDQNSRMIEVLGVNAVAGLQLQFSAHEGEELWTRLEDHLSFGRCQL